MIIDQYLVSVSALDLARLTRRTTSHRGHTKTFTSRALKIYTRVKTLPFINGSSSLGLSEETVFGTSRRKESGTNKKDYLI